MGKRVGIHAVGAVMVVALLGACAPIVRHYGFVPLPEDRAAIQPGESTRAEIDANVGAPGATGVISANTYYYVAGERHTFGPFAPREVAREVVAISFDTSGRVSNVERFGLEQGRPVVLSRRVTDAPTADISVIEQLLGNVGRIDPATILN